MSKEIISKYCSGNELSSEEMFNLFQNMLQENLADEDIKNFLLASSKRLPTALELSGAAKSLRANAQQINLSGLENEKVIDTCGTGGSGLDAFNTSTVASFILAAAGIYVAKHGNRAATSKCGSADLLTELGAKIDLPPKDAEDCLKKTKFTFLFAPFYHQATKRVQLLRKELGVKTIFNYLGPLSNPANPPYQVLGVSNLQMLKQVAETLLELGLKRAVVCCGEDGLDEVTLNGKSHCLLLNQGKLSALEINPRDFSLPLAKAEELKGATPDISKKYVYEILENKPGARANLVTLNAAVGFFVAEKTSSIAEGLSLAAEMLASGKALATLENYLKTSSSYGN